MAFGLVEHVAKLKSSRESTYSSVTVLGSSQMAMARISNLRAQVLPEERKRRWSQGHDLINPHIPKDSRQHAESTEPTLVNTAELLT